MSERYTLSIFTENSPGVLQRITIMFTRRKLNIDSLTVSETERKGVSRFTLVLNCDGELIRKIAKQIQRIIEVLHVDVFEDHELYHKELAFIRLKPESEKEREQILSIAKSFGVVALSDQETSIVLECVDVRERTDELCEALAAFEMSEFIRSGRIAIPKGGTTHRDALRLAM